MDFKKTIFDVNDFPSGFLAENKKSRELRKKIMIRNVNHENDVSEEYISQHFFSDENIEIINKMLVMNVFNKSKNTIKIPFQPKQDIFIVMQWVYVHYARHLPFKIKEQILELNQKVVTQLAPELMTQAQQHIDYLRDISKPMEPLPPPISASRDRTLPSISSIFHG